MIFKRQWHSRVEHATAGRSIVGSSLPKQLPPLWSNLGACVRCERIGKKFRLCYNTCLHKWEKIGANELKLVHGLRIPTLRNGPNTLIRYIQGQDAIICEKKTWRSFHSQRLRNFLFWLLTPAQNNPHRNLIHVYLKQCTKFSLVEPYYTMVYSRKVVNNHAEWRKIPTLTSKNILKNFSNIFVITLTQSPPWNIFTLKKQRHVQLISTRKRCICHLCG